MALVDSIELHMQWLLINFKYPIVKLTENFFSKKLNLWELKIKWIG